MPRNRGNNFIIITVIVIGILFLYFLSKPSIQSSQSKSTFVKDTGQVVFSVTDLAAKLENITSINITIDSILIHGTQNDSWINISVPQTSVDLLQLRSQNINAFLHDYYLPEGRYNQVRLDISNVVVVDWSGNKKAKLPSNTIKINLDLEVTEGTTSSILFDFIVDDSLHTTGGGNSGGVYIFAPIIKLTAKEKATVEIVDGKVNIYGGIVKTEAEIGVDERGNVGSGKKMDPTKRFSIQSGMLIPY